MMVGVIVQGRAVIEVKLRYMLAMVTIGGI
jgi:hypothetical protein